MATSPAFRPEEEPATVNPVGGDDAAVLSNVLTQASSMVARLLSRLRENEMALRKSSLQTLQHTSNKLEQVTSATETAANQIMDGMDRSLALVDQLEEQGSSPELAGALRDELMDAISQLQFQDITSQQLSHALSLLSELEEQLVTFAKLFDRAGISPDSDAEGVAAVATPGAFDPAANFDSAEDKQALVDQLLGR